MTQPRTHKCLEHRCYLCSSMHGRHVRVSRYSLFCLFLERNSNRESDTHTFRQADRWMVGGRTNRWIKKRTHREKGDRQTDRQAGRDRQTDRQTDRKRGRQRNGDRHTDRQTEKQKRRHKNREKPQKEVIRFFTPSELRRIPAACGRGNVWIKNKNPCSHQSPHH